MNWLMTSARRVLWLVVLGAAGGTAYTWWRERQAPTGPIDPPEWPPMHTDAASADPAGASADPTATLADPTDAPAVVADTTVRPAPERSTAAAFVNALVDTPDARSNASDGGWAPPNDDGSCPAGFPIKANDNSGIYHVPSGRFYARTKAERCYATTSGAEADGYRAAKS